MKHYRHIALVLPVSLLALAVLPMLRLQRHAPPCDTSVTSPRQCVPPPGVADAAAPTASERSMGQTIYVPVYSRIHYVNGKRYYDMAVTLSIRNTDAAKPIMITAVKYYDSAGKLVRQYIKEPVRLAPMASTEFFVGQQDTTGGIGANFIVEWHTDEASSAPVVESVMIGTAGTQQGISFVSPGRVIQQQAP